MRATLLAAILTTTSLFANPAMADGLAATSNTAPLVSAGDTELSHLGKSLLSADWSDYKERFIAADGRVIDTANGGISHSEGQGYGMLLAAFLGDVEDFERIWGWTKTHMLIRSDGLAAWKWDPVKNRIADTNNATDGDLLIAWALGEAATRFSRPDYAAAGGALASAIGRTVVRETPIGPVLLPGVDGFEPNGAAGSPVLNLSYWVYPAFPTLQRLAGDVDWRGVQRTGLSLLQGAQFGSAKLPADWIALVGEKPQPANGMPSRFGYNAIRIPLYLFAAQQPMPAGLQALSARAPSLPVPMIDLTTGHAMEPMGGSGFQLVLAAARCASGGPPVSIITTLPRDELYYPATLGLLAKWFLIERYPQCL